jgi:hypothetical protein
VRSISETPPHVQAFYRQVKDCHRRAAAAGITVEEQVILDAHEASRRAMATAVRAAGHRRAFRLREAQRLRDDLQLREVTQLVCVGGVGVARPTPREHRARSRDHRGPPAGDERPRRCSACGDWLSRRCVLCRGFPNPGVSIERLAAGVGQVDRAVRAFKAGAR